MTERRDPALTDLARRVANGVLIGTVSQVDHTKARYRVKAGGLETDWLPFAKGRSGGTRTFESLDEGEQVVVVSPSGDLSQGVIMGALDTNDTQAGASGSVHRTIYPDGTTIEYDHEAKAYKLSVAEGGSFALDIGGGAAISASGNGLVIKAASIKLEGAVEVEGESLSHNGVNVGDDHKHKDVTIGSDDTGEPV